MRSSSTIAVFATLYPPAYLGGGPIRSTEALIDRLPTGMTAFVLTSDRDLRQPDRLSVELNVWVDHPKAAVYFASLDVVTRLFRAYRSVKVRRPAVLYFNSFFHLTLSILPQILWRFGYWGSAVRLLAPRGEFGSGALGRRSFKKRMFIAVYRLMGLQRGITWHASSENEAADIRRVWGESTPILIRENETLLPQVAVVPKQASREGATRAVYLGRIVEHKGLHIALEALSQVRQPISLRVFGNEEDAKYAADCKALAGRLPHHIEVDFCGPILPRDVPRVLQSSDLMIMPTAGENFGHVIAEALSASCPVMCSNTTPWSAVLSEGGGVIVMERTAVAWRRALDEYLEHTNPQRHELRLRAAAAYGQWMAQTSAPHIFETFIGAKGIAR